MSNPWMKFYPSDWRADPALRMCSLGARGLWMEMLCLMHEAGGFLMVNGKELLPRQLAALAGASVDDVTSWLVELSDAGVFSRNEAGVIYSRRMVKDISKAEEDKANGRKGGNPKLKGGVNPPVGGGDKAQKPEARSQKLDISSETNVSGGAAPADETVAQLSSPDPRAELFTRGLAAVVSLTGKAAPQARTQIGHWLKLVKDEAVTVLKAIDDAVEHRPANPSAWIEAALRKQPNGKPRLTEAELRRLRQASV